MTYYRTYTRHWWTKQILIIVPIVRKCICVRSPKAMIFWIKTFNFRFKLFANLSAVRFGFHCELKWNMMNQYSRKIFISCYFTMEASSSHVTLVHLWFKTFFVHEITWKKYQNFFIFTLRQRCPNTEFFWSVFGNFWSSVCSRYFMK